MIIIIVISFFTCPPAILRAKILCKFVSKVELIPKKLIMLMMIIVMVVVMIMMMIKVIDDFARVDIKYQSVKVVTGYSKCIPVSY